MGKSTAARVFAARSIPIFDSDREVHRFYDSKLSGTLLENLVPDAIENGMINRKSLSEIVFKNPELLTKLEPIVHNAIRVERNDFVQMAKRLGFEVVILDTPLLFETGMEKEVDKTLLITATEQHQRDRALQRVGMTQERLSLILSRQMPDSNKRQKADFIIENDEQIPDLEASVSTFIDNLKYQTKLVTP